MKSISSARKSRRGRPRVDAVPVNTRFPLEDLERLDAWRAKQSDRPGRPEAIRQLIKQALASKGARRPPSKGAARKAAQMAASVIENLGDKSEPAVEQQRRKRTLIRGPTEFRDIRADLPKPKS